MAALLTREEADARVTRPHGGDCIRCGGSGEHWDCFAKAYGPCGLCHGTGKSCRGGWPVGGPAPFLGSITGISCTGCGRMVWPAETELKDSATRRRESVAAAPGR